MTAETRRLSAPAKINLTLHVTGRRNDGYHLLESLVAFADVGDEIVYAPSADFSFTIDGPFAAAIGGLQAEDNLAVRALRRMSLAFDRKPDGAWRLTKNLPPAAGLGGGSADAAAAARLLASVWGVNFLAAMPQLASLGADVLVCLTRRPMWMAGIGEVLAPAPALPPAAFVLVNPGIVCPTPDVFGRLAGRFGTPLARPSSFDNVAALADFIRQSGNDLTPPAQEIAPMIGDVCAALDTGGSLISRMCGSGATCFGLFATPAAAAQAARRVAARQPGWWVRAGALLA